MRFANAEAFHVICPWERCSGEDDPSENRMKCGVIFNVVTTVYSLNSEMIKRACRTGMNDDEMRAEKQKFTLIRVFATLLSDC